MELHSPLYDTRVFMLVLNNIIKDKYENYQICCVTVFTKGSMNLKVPI